MSHLFQEETHCVDKVPKPKCTQEQIINRSLIQPTHTFILDANIPIK